MLTKEDILLGLTKLAHMAEAEDRHIEIAVFGGSAIVLEWEFRKSTRDRDIDIVVSQDAAFVRSAARSIAAEMGWPEDWMNDAVKGYVSETGSLKLFCELPLGAPIPSLRVFIPSPEYLLAMKCLAMRIGGLGEQSDLGDIRQLIRLLRLTKVEDVFHLIESYYPHSRIPPKVQFGIQQIMEEIVGADTPPEKS